MADEDGFPVQAVLMLTVALEELRSMEAETELGRIRTRIAAVEATLTELLEIAKKTAGE